MKVILFDGVCNLCNGLVNWIIDRDKKNVFKFSSLQSGFGMQKVNKLQLTDNYMDTVIYLDDEKAFTGSTAILHIFKDLGGVYSLLYVFMLVPGVIRNFVYRLVARNRYKWFGKQDSCRMPTPQLKSKFLE
jgi:predicted DCC family thiol-disulfide oxidoreductase YuxK